MPVWQDLNKWKRGRQSENCKWSQAGHPVDVMFEEKAHLFPDNPHDVTVLMVLCVDQGY